MKKQSTIIKLALAIILAFVFSIAYKNDTYARTAITVSPMHQTMVLIPGEEVAGNFIVANPGDNTEDQEYELEVRPFFMDQNNEITYTFQEDYTQIVEWIKLEKTTGKLAPNENEIVNFTISVPKNAPAGGQYASIIVRGTSDQPNSLVINNFEVAHLVYAEVAGETKHDGRVLEASIPGFMLSGKITGTALVQNNGNVHAYAKQTLKILPLFGDEEYYTNENEPKENFLMPEAKQYTSVSWDDTPSIGIFRAEYDIEFEGVITKVEKTVIICPLWLLINIAAIIAIIIYRIVSAMITKKDKKE